MGGGTQKLDGGQKTFWVGVGRKTLWALPHKVFANPSCRCQQPGAKKAQPRPNMFFTMPPQPVAGSLRLHLCAAQPWDTLQSRIISCGERGNFLESYIASSPKNTCGDVCGIKWVLAYFLFAGPRKFTSQLFLTQQTRRWHGNSPLVENRFSPYAPRLYKTSPANSLPEKQQPGQSQPPSTESTA